MRKKEHGIIPGGVLVSPKTSIPIGLGGMIPVKAVKQEDKWEGPLPKGWTGKSRSSFYKSMSDPEDVSKHECEEEEESGHEEGPTATCMKKIAGHVSDPGAFCASLRDQVTGTTHWRHGGGKKK